MNPGRYPVPIPGLSSMWTHDRQADLVLQRLLHEFQGFVSFPGQEGEGDHSAARVVRAEEWADHFIADAANCCGPPPPRGLGRLRRPGHDPVRKRSFRRACRRAFLNSFTWYQGRLWSFDDFPPALRDRVSAPPSPNPRDSGLVSVGHRPRGRLNFLHWNSGGLSHSRFVELKLWLQTADVDGFIISETRWGFTREWSTAHWHFVHSGAGTSRSAGVLIAISTRLATSAQLGWREIEPGRLLHVRVHFKQRSLDLLGIYQFTFDHTPKGLDQRLTLWHQLNDTLAGLPTRNMLLLGGDLNCTLTSSPPHIGCDHFCWRHRRQTGPVHSDSHELLALLKTHHLCALNTWNGSDVPTYCHGDVGSRIDYFITRLGSCDGQSKRVKLLPTADIVPLSSTYHVPMICSILKMNIQYQRTAPTGCTLVQRLRCRQARLQDSSDWQHFVQKSTQALTDQLTSATELNVDTLHNTLLPIFQAAFSTSPCAEVAPGDISQHIKNKWQAKSSLRALRGTELVRVFQAWHLCARYLFLKRTQQRVALQDRQRRFADLCIEVERSAAQHDAFGMFQVINRYTPRRLAMRVRLRTADGHIADQHTSHDLLVKFVASQWDGPSAPGRPLDVIPGVPFSLVELENAIAHIPVTKSVAPGCVPGVVWRHFAPVLAPELYHWLTFWWSQSPPYIPSSWKDSWLVFIPKPGKLTSSPGNLRPLSLQEPLGKCVMGLLTVCLQNEVHSHLTYIPQFAYVSQRSALDAIRRVALHCATIRQRMQCHRRNIHGQMSGIPPQQLHGGIQLFLDLSRAFDELCRSELFHHLPTLNVSPSLLSLIQERHSSTGYYVGAGDTSTRVQVGKGVRQGCKMAPTLWACFIHLLVSKLIPKVGLPWLLSNLTIFADDIHLAGAFANAAELRLTLTNFGHVLDTLEELQMHIQYSKSCLLFRADGTHSRHFHKEYVRHAETGTTFALTRASGQIVHFPVADRAKYLGVVMCYRQFEDLTLEHRLVACKTAFHRMKPWLKARGIGVQSRLQLLRTCVFTVRYYGLSSVGFTIKGLHSLTSVMLTMIRQVVGDHAYLTRHSHQQVLHSFGILHPLLTIHGLGMQLWRTLTWRSSQLSSWDILHRVDWSFLPEQLTLIRMVHEHSAQVSVRESLTVTAQAPPQLQCPWCHFCTNSIPNLRRHCTTVHHRPALRIHSVHLAHHAYLGRPQCSSCHEMFASWRQFFIHIERQCCQVCIPVQSLQLMETYNVTADGRLRFDHLHMVETQPFGHRVLDLLDRLAWQELDQHPEACSYLVHHCCICGAWNNRTQELHAHYRLQHAGFFRGVLSKSSQVCAQQIDSSPCKWCDKDFTRHHTCNVLTQLSMLWLNSLGSEERERAMLRCDVCQTECSSHAELHQHLRLQHGLQTCDWNPARDQLPGAQNSCRHCGSIFQSRDGLRRHILDGRCDSFDADAACVTVGNLTPWLDIIHAGTFCTMKPHDRLTLTLKCQLCLESYTRQQDLACHLQYAHGELWHRSLSTLRLLLNMVVTDVGCICNPATSTTGLSHVCPGLRQLAMIAEHSSIDLVVPMTYSKPKLQWFFERTLPHAAIPLISQCLLNRDFAQLWTLPDIVMYLRHWCLLCGGWHHPGALVSHLLTEHHLAMKDTTLYVPQLLKCLQRLCPTDWECHACGQCFNVPLDSPTLDDLAARRATQEVHFSSNCPVLHQLAILLTLPNGRFGRDARCGRQAADGEPGSSQPAPENVSSLPKRRRRGERQETTQRGPAPGQGASGSNADPSDVQTAAAAGQGCAVDEKARLLSLLHASVRTERLPNVDHPGDQLEDASRGQENRQPSPALEILSDAESCQGAPGQGRSAGGMQTSGGALASSPDERHGDTGGRLALSDLGCQDGHPANLCSTTHADGASAETAPSLAGIDDGAGEPPEVQQPEATGQFCGLDDTSGDPSRRSLAGAQESLRADMLVIGGQQLEAAQPLSIQACPSTSGVARLPETQRPGERQDQESPLTPDQRHAIRRALSDMMLLNRGVHCYANSAWITMMWALASRHQFSFRDWGDRAPLFAELLTNHLTEPLELAVQPWIIALLLAWPDDEGSGEADCSEFTDILLDWVQPECYSGNWEKRFLLEQKVVRHDHGSVHSTLTLQLDPELAVDGVIPFRHMLRSWHSENGMVQALVNPQDVICVHIDRLCQNRAGELVRCALPIGMHGGIEIPVFTGPDLQVEWHDYQVLAAISHRGSTVSGHYSSLLKIDVPPLSARVDPVMWVFKDDNRAPRVCWAEPPGFVTNLTQLWLVRIDSAEALCSSTFGYLNFHGVDSRYPLTGPIDTPWRWLCRLLDCDIAICPGPAYWLHGVGSRYPHTGPTDWDPALFSLIDFPLWYLAQSHCCGVGSRQLTDPGIHVSTQGLGARTDCSTQSAAAYDIAYFSISWGGSHKDLFTGHFFEDSPCAPIVFTGLHIELISHPDWSLLHWFLWLASPFTLENFYQLCSWRWQPLIDFTIYTAASFLFWAPLLATLALGCLVTLFNWSSLSNTIRFLCPFHFSAGLFDFTYRSALSGGKSGPKSRRGHSRLASGSALLCYLLALLILNMNGHRGEGCDSPMGVTGTADWWIADFIQNTAVKTHGMQPSACFGTNSGLENTRKVVKRSLRRAHRRAAQFGMAWYRGRCYLASDFSPSLQTVPASSPTPQQYKDLTTCNMAHSPRRRLKCMAWNCGGLAAPRLDELRVWAQAQQLDALVLLETRWTYSHEWSDATWHYLHTGEEGQKNKGILLMISRKLCAPHQIKWNDCIPGRLLHVCLQTSSRHTDLVCCYQYTCDRTRVCMQNREKFWSGLDSVLRALPHRNSLVLLGDFNCSLPPMTSFAGSHLFKWKDSLTAGTQHADAGRFASLVRHYGLVALNSWNATLGPTYIHNDAVSRIDYIFTRKHTADGLARQIGYLWNSPFMPLSPAGHVPLLCSLPLYWIPSTSQNQPGRISMQQRRAGRQAMLAQDSKWQTLMTAAADSLQQMQDDTLGALNACPIEQLHSKVMQQFNLQFPAVPSISNAQPWQQAAPVIQTQWQHRRLFLEICTADLTGMFRAWFHWSRFQHLKRLHRKQAHQLRKQKFQDIVCEAAIASSRHDMHALFSLINKHSPKQPHKRIQLRNQQGMIATPVEAKAILTGFVADMWRGPSHMNMQFAEPPGVPFELETLVSALRRIPVNKAVAYPFVPGMVWHSMADQLGPVLYNQLQRWWNQSPPHVPLCWRSGWLHFIPKPQKAPTCPAHLRPLIMQEPVGKAIFGILTALAMNQTLPLMISFPIFAYVPGRSTLDAILKVTHHCNTVKSMISGQRSTPHSRASGLVHYRLCGGLQIFVDIQRAFDSVCRRKLFQRLHELHITMDLIQLFTVWHEDSIYHVQHDSDSSPVDVGRGLRQGCKGAPFLWNCFLVIFLTDLMQHVPLHWIQRCLTIYANDCHIGGTFTDALEFKYLLDTCGLVFSTLQSLDMQVNPSKSVALLAMAGTMHRPIRAKHVKRTDKGEYVKIPLPNGNEMLIKLETKAKYLGTIISYTCLEDATLSHRLQLAQLGFHRMRSWLCSRGRLTTSQRYKLWRQCILPILTYGILATDITNKGLRLIQQKIYGMLRQIAHDHPYISHHTNTEALAIHRLPTPFELLHGVVNRLKQSVAQRRLQLLPFDLSFELDWSHLDSLLQRIESFQVVVPTSHWVPAFGEVPITQPIFQCALCSFWTCDVSHFRRHCTTAHGQRMYRTRYAIASDFTVDGLPTCRFCHTKFSTWRSFQQHIERGCQALILGPADCALVSKPPGLSSLQFLTESMATSPDTAMRGARKLQDADLHHLLQQEFGVRLLQLIDNRAWHDLAREQHACAYLRKHCVLCNQFLDRAQTLNQHFKQEHSDFWPWVQEKGVQLTNLNCSDSPCEYCGSGFKVHQCPIWLQVALLLVNGATLPDSVIDEPQWEVRHRCELCFEVLSTAADLAQHLQSVHHIGGLTYNVARDCLPDAIACSHCGIPFTTEVSLRSHIVQGRCSAFNPQAEAEVKAVTPELKGACCEGQLHNFLTVMNRLHLTIHCQFCDKVYSRAADLAGHLISCHTRPWRKSQRLTHVRVQLLYPKGCICNPGIGVKRNNHICIPIRQLSMTFARLEQGIFCPFPVTDAMLAATLSTSLSATVRFQIEQFLAARDFKALWQDPGMQRLLRQQCLFCGAQHTAGDLSLHLHEAHPCGHMYVQYYMEQLLPLILSLNTEDFRCHLCEQIFNLPWHLKPDESQAERLALAQSHLKGHCPNLVQICLLLSSILHGRSLVDGDLRHPHEHAGRLLQTTPKKEEQGQLAMRLLGMMGTLLLRHEQDLNLQRREDSFVIFCNRAPEGVLQILIKETKVWKDQQQQNPGKSAMLKTPPPPALVSGIAEGPHESSSASQQVCQNRPALSGHDGPRHPLGGLQLAVPGVGSSAENLDHCQSSTHFNEQNATTHRRDDEHGGGQCDDTSFSRSAFSGKQPDHSLAAASQQQTGQTLGTTCSIEQQRGLGIAWHQPQTALHAGFQLGQDDATVAAAQEGIRQGQEQAFLASPGQARDEHVTLVPELPAIVMRLRFANNSRWCYANTTFYGLLWTLLCLEQQGHSVWGNHYAKLKMFLYRHERDMALLAHETWFTQILQSWGQPLVQNDCAEFTSAVLAWLNAPAIDLRWERRLLQNDASMMFDHNSAHMPVILKFWLPHDPSGTYSISDLLDNWRQVDGMSTALLSAPQVLCLHIDRMFEDSNAVVQKSGCSIDLNPEALIPCFTSSGLATEPVGYVPVAVAAHLGADGTAGHYRAALKVRASLSHGIRPTQWLLTEDAQQPSPLWRLPPWFLQAITVIWLVRTDCLILPSFWDAECTDPTQAILAVLGNTPA
eukprot:s3830_g1.t1